MLFNVVLKLQKKQKKVYFLEISRETKPNLYKQFGKYINIKYYFKSGFKIILNYLKNIYY